MAIRKDIWIVTKKIWYIPFFWSLAWFSYWIGYSIFVHNQLLAQINPEYYYGMTISIAAILVAGYISGKSTVKKIKVAPSIKKELSMRNSLNETYDQRQIFNQDFVHRTEMEEDAQNQQIDHGSLVETFQRERPLERSEELTQEPAQTPATPHTSSIQVKPTDQPRKPQETPSDCFVCPNLMNCTERQKRITDPETPCPLAKKLNKNPFESQ
jgi:hypothetical protein